MKWIILVIAGLLEVVWAVGLKYTEGFTRTWPTLLTSAAMLGSIVLLGIAMKDLPVGAAYGIWVGIGAVGAAIMGVVLFGESLSALKIASLVLIVTGIAGLKVSV
jgi:quaternary ammonium compound-resistance protein SugE